MTSQHSFSLRFCPALFIAFALLTYAATITAQSATATLTGTVQDENGALVAGASVLVISTATGFKREATTNEQGSFSVPLIQPGSYGITVRRDGFAPLEVKNVILNIGDQKALIIQLKPGDVNASVQVSAEAALINESPAVSTVVDRQFVSNMPLNGRSFQNLIDLAPGVLPNTGRGQFNVNGQQSTSNYLTIDGVSANVSGQATFDFGPSIAIDSPGSFPPISATGGFNGMMSVDSLQEFRIQTSTYAPEFGRLPGAQISLISRSGNNSFRGTLSEYLRNDAFDANDWFSNRNGFKRTALRQNDFGVVVGGPVLVPKVYDGRNRSFFFFSYEGLRLRIPASGTVVVPSMSLRQDPSLSAALRPFLNAYPTPNGRDFLNGTAAFNYANSNPSTLDATSIRIDHSLTRNTTVFGRYNRSTSDSVAGTFYQTPTVFNFRTLTLGSTQIISAKINNEALANYSDSILSVSRDQVSYGGSAPVDDSLLFPSPYSSADAYTIRYFRITSTNAAIDSFGQGTFATQEPRLLNFIDNLSVLAGSHQLKFGADYRYVFPSIRPSKYLTFLGVDISTNKVVPGSAIRAEQQITIALSNFSAYGQDTWKINPRLTLTYGLRWDVNTPPKGLNGKDLYTAQGVDNPTTATVAPVGTPLFKTDYSSIAPRFGVSYLLRDGAGRETVVRGGFGVFYDASVGNLSSGTYTTPWGSVKPLANFPFPLSPADAAPIPVGILRTPYTLFAAVSGLKLPYSLQWNAAIEQSLGGRQSISLTYVGAAGRRLLSYEALFNPNPKISELDLYRDIGYSNYRALQVEFKRRLTRGLQALTSYSWSRSLDTSSSNISAVLPLPFGVFPDKDYAVSDFDISHAFKGAVSYNIPAPSENKVAKSILGGFALDVLFIAQSARPVNVQTGTNPLNAFVSARPNLIPGVPFYLDDPTAPGARRFNDSPYSVADNARLASLGCLWVARPAGDTTTPIGPAKGAFCTPANGIGNFPRNGLRGFPLSQVDLALRREFKFGERVRLQLRGEAFNLFNHPNFAKPSNSLNSGLFGRSSSMAKVELGGLNTLYQLGGQRSMQFGVKLNF